MLDATVAVERRRRPVGRRRPPRGNDEPVERVEGLERTVFGRGQVIARDENGVLWGGSDPRGGRMRARILIHTRLRGADGRGLRGSDSFQYDIV